MKIVKNFSEKNMLYLLLDAYDTVNRTKLKEILENLARRSQDPELGHHLI